MAKKQKFPRVLYVVQEEGSDEEWLHCESKLQHLAEVGSRTVAIYQLLDVRELIAEPVLK